MGASSGARQRALLPRSATRSAAGTGQCSEAVFGPRQAYWFAGEFVWLPSRRAACADGFGRGVTHVPPIFSAGRKVLADRGLRETGTPSAMTAAVRVSPSELGAKRVVEFPAGTPENFHDAPRSESRGYFANMSDPAKECRRGAGRPAPRRGFGRFGFRRESVDAWRTRCAEASDAGLRRIDNPMICNGLPRIVTTRKAWLCALIGGFPPNIFKFLYLNFCMINDSENARPHARPGGQAGRREKQQAEPVSGTGRTAPSRTRIGGLEPWSRCSQDRRS